MITALIALALAPQPPADADEVKLSDQDRAQIIRAFRYDWEKRREEMIARYPERRHQAPELIEVEVVRCDDSPSLPGCDLRVTARRDGETKSGEMGWRFRRSPDGSWTTASVSSRLNTSK